MGSGPPLFPTNLRQQVRQSDNGPHECVCVREREGGRGVICWPKQTTHSLCICARAPTKRTIKTGCLSREKMIAWYLSEIKSRVRKSCAHRRYLRPQIKNQEREGERERERKRERKRACNTHHHPASHI